MRRRIAVPDLAGVASSVTVARLHPLLEPRAAMPVYDRRLHPLAGVRWPRGIPAAPLPHEVALFDITDPGELQDW